MTPFALFVLLLLAAATAFALGNPGAVTLRFLVWQFETTVALAVLGAAVIGGLLVFVSSALGQRHLRARLRETQARLRALEARAQDLPPGPDRTP
ncbi:MAG: LapA family protein [Armatimonadota bacterium]|nr:LapA family protein [Armatimonadota bacterium]